MRCGSAGKPDVSEEWGLDGHTNMGRDAALLASAEKGRDGCRVYSWDGPWISLGMMQVAERDLLPTNPVPWVMRPTGGKAVLHGHDVTVGLAVPLAAMVRHSESVERLSRSVRTVYRRIAAPLVVALQGCGLPARLAEETRFVGEAGRQSDPDPGDGTAASRLREPSDHPHLTSPVKGEGFRTLPMRQVLKGEGSRSFATRQISRGTGRTADCFAHVSPNDIVHEVSGQKVCGCALRLTSSAVLVQASIPNGPPLVDPRLVFAAPNAMNAVRWDASEFAEKLGDALAALTAGP